MLLNFALIFGLVRGQDLTSWYGSFNLTELLQGLTVVNFDEISGLLGDEDFQKFTISDGLDLISAFQDTDTCSDLLDDLFYTIENAIDQEYDDIEEEYAVQAVYNIGSNIANSFENTQIEYTDTTAIINLGSMIKSLIDNMFVRQYLVELMTNLMTDYYDNVDIDDVRKLIQAIKSYGTVNFCQDIKIDDNEDGVDTMNELIESNTADDTYISIGANLNAAFTILRKIVKESDFDFLQTIMNPTVSAGIILEEISRFIGGDPDAMNAWKVLSGKSLIIISILRDIVVYEIDLDDTIFADIGDIAEDLKEDLMEDFSNYDERFFYYDGDVDYDDEDQAESVSEPDVQPETWDYDVADYKEELFEDMIIYGLTTGIVNIQMTLLRGITTGIASIAQLPVFTNGKLLIPDCDYDFDECLSAFSEQLIDNIEDIRMAVFCGSYPDIGDSIFDSCDAWNEFQTIVMPTIEAELPTESYDDYLSDDYFIQLDQLLDYLYLNDNINTTESTVVSLENQVIEDGYILSIAAGIIVLFLFIITIMGLWQLCRRNRWKYDKLQNAPSYSKLDKRVEDV